MAKKKKKNVIENRHNKMIVGKGDQILITESGQVCVVETFVYSSTGGAVIAVSEDGSEFILEHIDFNKTWSMI